MLFRMLFKISSALCVYVFISDAPELSLAQLGFSSSWRLFSSAHGILGIARLAKILLKWAKCRVWIFARWAAKLVKTDHLNSTSILWQIGPFFGNFIVNNSISVYCWGLLKEISSFKLIPQDFLERLLVALCTMSTMSSSYSACFLKCASSAQLRKIFSSARLAKIQLEGITNTWMRTGIAMCLEWKMGNFSHINIYKWYH